MKYGFYEKDIIWYLYEYLFKEMSLYSLVS